MKNKKEIAIVALTTGLALTSIVPYERLCGGNGSNAS